MNNQKGQVTIFVIIGIVIVIAGILFFSLRGNLSKQSIPNFIEPIENSFSSCIERKVDTGIKILASKGGYIYNPVFVPGSTYQPFSSELEFVGVDIPYWYYIKGSNVEATQIPTKDEMQSQLERYISESITDCSFIEFRDQGYFVDLGESEVKVLISDDYVDVNVKSNLVVSKDSQTYVVGDRSLRIKSSLGKLYNSAIKIYEKEQIDFFIENYSVDNMRLYLPVDGFEISCSPLSWNGFDLFKIYSEMLEANTILLNNQGKKNDYYDVGISGDFDLRFIYSSNWPTYFEVNPTQGEKLIAKPIGNNADFGILGFCYIPYHFVYNIRHPVLIQLNKDEEIFQFPLVVVIAGNVPKESRATGSEYSLEGSQICEEMNLGKIKIEVYDSNLNLVDAELSFSCFDSNCDLGNSAGGKYEGSVPQCVNGILTVNKEGYKTEKITHTTVQESQLSIFLEEEYEKEISLIVEGEKYYGNAFITFNSDLDSKSIFYPEQKKISLYSGNWEMTVNLISNTSITLPETETEQCYDVQREGVLGYLGMTKQVCSQVKIPQELITNAIVGGGIIERGFSLSELKNFKTIEFYGLSKRTPTSLEELQINYALLDSGVMEVELK